MEGLLARLWSDDGGAVLATEFLVAATALVLGLLIGLTGIRDGVNARATTIANALLALSQGYTISGVSGCAASTSSSQTLDTPGTLANPVYTAPATPTVITVPVS